MKAMRLLFVAITLIGASCRKDNAPHVAPITQHYTATYNVTTGLTEMRASFFYNPNNTVLPGDFAITCNGIALERFLNANGSSYYIDTAVGNPDARFELREDDGNILGNTMLSSIIPVINFDSTFTASSASMADTLVIPFSGGPLTNGVSITVTINQDANHYTYHHETIAIGDSVVVFLPADLSVLQAGPATITISRIGPVWGLQETDPGAGGDMRYTVMATRAITITN